MRHYLLALIVVFATTASPIATAQTAPDYIKKLKFSQLCIAVGEVEIRVAESLYRGVSDTSENRATISSMIESARENSSKRQSMLWKIRRALPIESQPSTDEINTTIRSLGNQIISDYRNSGPNKFYDMMKDCSAFDRDNEIVFGK